MNKVPIKFQLFIAIMIVFIIIFVIGYGKINRKNSPGDSTLGSENLENGSVDKETGTYYQVSNSGANSSKNCPYYVEEMYADSPESNYIGVGYFVITKEDGIKESIQLKTPEELSRIKKEPDIGLEATRRAREILKTNDDVDVIDSKRFFLDKGNENISLCYRVLFSDGKKMFINGITGEEMEN